MLAAGSLKRKMKFVKRVRITFQVKKFLRPLEFDNFESSQEMMQGNKTKTKGNSQSTQNFIAVCLNKCNSAFTIVARNIKS